MQGVFSNPNGSNLSFNNIPRQDSIHCKLVLDQKWPTFAHLAMIIFSGPTKSHSRSFKKEHRIPLEAGL